MTVRLYTRAGCHLCEVVEQILGDLADEYPHELQRYNIDRDPALRQRYDWAVPVVIIDERWRLATRIDRAVLRQALEVASRAG